MDLKGIFYDVAFIHLAYDMEQWWALVKMVKFVLIIIVENLSTGCATVSFSRRTVPRGVSFC
jgi:hypothetical protein